ncbi:TlyA family RNA methyltransferase [Candidatus Sumerlaeota bacterium]|nr:TlyA family RNA methyltransferase [Candidatus Sumerlaeota bacterium]
MSAKTRLDQALVERGLAETRSKARALILAGDVSVDGRRADKAGVGVATDACIEVKAAACPFVSRGGLKLAGFLDQFPFPITNAICADIGASTGGFTDCLLQRGAAKVYAVDVGYGQLEYKLRNDARVSVMERFNARSLGSETFCDPIEFFCIDVSFISLEKIIPGLLPAVGEEPVDCVALIKPQFEAGKAAADKGAGVIRDPQEHRRALENVWRCFETHGWKPLALVPSSIKGATGNVEFLIGCTRRDDPRTNEFGDTRSVDVWIEEALSLAHQQ